MMSLGLPATNHRHGYRPHSGGCWALRAWQTVGRIITRVADEASRSHDRLDGCNIGIDDISWRRGQRYLTLVIVDLLSMDKSRGFPISRRHMPLPVRVVDVSSARPAPKGAVLPGLHVQMRPARPPELPWLR
jgi:hypothetical protein